MEKKFFKTKKEAKEWIDYNFWKIAKKVKNGYILEKMGDIYIDGFNYYNSNPEYFRTKKELIEQLAIYLIEWYEEI